MPGRRLFLKNSTLAAGAIALPDWLLAGERRLDGRPPWQGHPGLPLVLNVDAQPLITQTKRLLAALDYLGVPLGPSDRRALEAAFALAGSDRERGVAGIQQVLDRSCLVGIEINPEARVRVRRGPASAELIQHGWRQFLVKVHNEAGSSAILRAGSAQARPLAGSPPDAIPDLWLDLMMFDREPLTKNLSGLSLEYRIVQLYSRDPGRREATLAFDIGQGTQDLGFRNDLPILFTCRPAQAVKWRVLEANGTPAMAAFLIRDAQDRVYPSRAKRLAPDFAFHPQVYRADGEEVILPAGTYTIEFWRGPESVRKTQTLTIPELDRRTSTRVPTNGVPSSGVTASFQVERWIDPSKLGWWSGDHHIHAAGCAHYNRPNEGVSPADMMRHILGEDLKVGANLTWGPGFDYQKQFFTGGDDKVSERDYLLHYDIEVSGFGSHRSGHLVLLRLKEQIYPGGDSDTHWPSLCLNTLRWAKKQGAVCGPAHSGLGLEVPTDELPNYIVPAFDSIGAMEYIVDVTHEVPGPDGRPVPAVDFISTVDTQYPAELNIWYHTLNVGYRTRISGETDFPCMSGNRVGEGRSYVRIDGPLTYAAWCEGLARGKNYVTEGKSHLPGFRVNDVTMGEGRSELTLSAPGKVQVTLKAAALLSEQISSATPKRPYTDGPYWDLERARQGTTRNVPVEIVVNGYPVARELLVADGSLRDLTFTVAIEQSSWVAARILGSSHTNPVWVLIGERPVRASRRSAEWCLKAVDQCWMQKERFIKPDELAQAKVDYEHARQAYKRILSESERD